MARLPAPVESNFSTLSVAETARCFRECRLNQLADLCEKEALDGCFIDKMTPEDLSKEPFNLTVLHRMKVEQIKNGWRPNCEWAREIDNLTECRELYTWPEKWFFPLFVKSRELSLTNQFFFWRMRPRALDLTVSLEGPTTRILGDCYLAISLTLFLWLLPRDSTT